MATSPLTGHLVSVKLAKPTAITDQELRMTVQAISGILVNIGSLQVHVGEADPATGGCSMHNCSGFEEHPPDDPKGPKSCDTEACTSHACSGQDCDTNSCSAHACSDANFSCGSHETQFDPAPMRANQAWADVLNSMSHLKGTWTSGVSVTTPRR
jgi:hypothetical protein